MTLPDLQDEADPRGIAIDEVGIGGIRYRRATGSAMGMGPALGDEIAMPAQKSCRLDEEVPATLGASNRASPASTARSAGLSAGRWT